MSKFRTVPEDTSGMPGGVPFIIANEAAERFSYYGMRSILVVYMTNYLLMSPESAKGWYSLFLSSVYIFPVLGALVSDGWLGKYRTIIYLSLVYCLGHLVLGIAGTEIGNAMWLTPKYGLAAGLFLIALGSGGIKPCVSANVGDQFGPRNRHLLEKVYGWFYFSINAGSMLSTILIPWMLEDENFGPHWAFGVPGILMGLATLFFWMGRNRYAHVPPSGLGFLREAATPEGMRALRTPILVTFFVAMFWCLYDQSSSAWILQAENMDLYALGREWLPAQIHTINPVLILLFIPLFTYVIYPAINRVFTLTPIRKIAIGLFLTAVSFLVSAWIEVLIDREMRPHVSWQVLAYIILTAAEVMVSITGLEYSYTVAPKSMKSIVMAIWLFAVALGNLFTAAVNFAIQDEEGRSRLTNVEYYLFFAGAMAVWAVGFVIVSNTMFPKKRANGPDAAA